MFIVVKGKERLEAKLNELEKKGSMHFRTEMVYKEDIEHFEEVYEYLVINNNENAYSHKVEDECLLNEVRIPLVFMKEGVFTKDGYKVPFSLKLEFNYTWRGFKCRYEFISRSERIFDSVIVDMENNSIIEEEYPSVFTKDEFLWFMSYIYIMQTIRYSIEDTEAFKSLFSEKELGKSHKNIYHYIKIQ